MKLVSGPKKIKHVNKKSSLDIFLSVLKYILLIIPVFFFAFPFFILISRSFFSTEELTSIGAGVITKSPTLDAYREAFKDPKFLLGLKNTLIIVVCNVIGVPFTAFMAAFAFTKIKFKFRRIIFTIALGTIMIPGILLMLPVYKIFVDINWYDTLLPLTIPCFFGGGILNIFMIMQFIRAIPKEIDEAAIIDGASVFRRMFFITLPLIKPIIIYLMVTAFFGAWNDLMSPLLYIMSEENYTVNMYLYETFLNAEEIEFARPNVQMALGVILMIPMLVVYVIFQKQLINGLTFGAVKE